MTYFRILSIIATISFSVFVGCDRPRVSQIAIHEEFLMPALLDQVLGQYMISKSQELRTFKNLAATGGGLMGLVFTIDADGWPIDGWKTRYKLLYGENEIVLISAGPNKNFDFWLPDSDDLMVRSETLHKIPAFKE